jgi:hypothetical protein
MLGFVTALSGSVYGIALLLAPLFIVAYGASRLMGNSKAPFVVAAVIAVPGALLLPLLPRLAFERNAQQQVQRIPGIKLVDATRWADVTEPMTWFYAPFGHFRFARPESPIEDITGPNRTFRELVLRYGDEPAVYIVSVFCNDRTFMLSAPDEEGTFRTLNKDWQSLDTKDAVTFCETDWSAEQQAMRAAISGDAAPSQ